MTLPKWYLISIVVLSVISTGIQSSSETSTGQAYIQKREVSTPNQSFNAPSYWEHILREFVFKTISPPPPGNNQLYKHLLEAPFYGGPYPNVPNNASSVVLSRGDVYYLPNGHWVFCSQGCSHCELCMEHTHPAVKWVLRRIKRVSSHGPTRHDLQLTIVPQVDGSYHMRSLWPQSYVYVTSQGEQDAYLNDKHGYSNDGHAYVNVEDSFSGQQKKIANFWRHVDTNSLPEGDVVEKIGNNTAPQAQKRTGNNSREIIQSTTAIAKKEDVGEQKNEAKFVGRQRPQMKPTEKENRSDSTSTDVRLKENEKRVKQLIPKLILGTDQKGQKHLVHVIPADGSTNTSLMNSIVSNVLSSAGQNKTAYQRILRRIFDSLNSNRKSIESFLEPLTTTERMSLEGEEHQLQETRGGFPGLRQANRFHPSYNKAASNESSFQKRWPHSLNRDKQRRISNNDTAVNKFINHTVGIEHKTNNSFILHPSNNNTIDNNLRTNNVTRTNEKYAFPPRKYKILLTTEASTKLNESVNHGKSIKNSSYLTFSDQSTSLNRKNFMNISDRNSTQ